MKNYFTMAELKIDNKCTFTLTNNAWNTNSGIKKTMFLFFFPVQIFIALSCQGYGKQTVIIIWR